MNKGLSASSFFVPGTRGRWVALVSLGGIALCWSLVVSSFAAADSGSSAGDGLDLFKMVIGLLGGLALFLFGMEQMADALKAVAGDRMRTVLAKLTTNRYSGALTGALVTAIIQSSSVTTVLVVGFITAEVMSLSQAVGVIFGANVGTTVTAQIIAFKVTKYALLLIALGFAMLFVAKKERVRQYGAMIMGLGLVFYGMSIMSDGMRPLRTYQPFMDLMGRMENPLLGVLISAVFTGLVQSSSATTGIIIVMASQGLISLPAGIALVFGANVGTCVTALLASLGKPREALRAGAAHVVFNIGGVLLWIGVIGYLARFVTWMSPVAEGLVGIDKLAAETPRQIANAHTVFNIVNTLIALPLAGLVARLVEWMIPDKAVEALESGAPPPVTTQFLNTALFDTPVLAVEHARLEIIRVAGIARSGLAAIVPAIVSDDAEAVDEMVHRGREIEFLQAETSEYIAHIAHGRLTLELSDRTMRLRDVSTVLEHVAEVLCENMAPLLTRKIEGSIGFSEAGQQELVDYHARVLAAYDRAIKAFEDMDAQLAEEAVSGKSELDQLEQTYRRSHYARLDDAEHVDVSIENSHVFLEILDQLRRISSYSESIAESLL